MTTRFTATDKSGKQISQWDAGHDDDGHARAEAAEQRADALEHEVARLRTERDTAIEQKVAAEKEAARWMRITEQLREDTERAVKVSRGSASRVSRVHLL